MSKLHYTKQYLDRIKYLSGLCIDHGYNKDTIQEIFHEAIAALALIEIHTHIVCDIHKYDLSTLTRFDCSQHPDGKRSTWVVECKHCDHKKEQVVEYQGSCPWDDCRRYWEEEE